MCSLLEPHRPFLQSAGHSGNSYLAIIWVMLVSSTSYHRIVVVSFFVYHCILRTHSPAHSWPSVIFFLTDWINKWMPKWSIPTPTTTSLQCFIVTCAYFLKFSLKLFLAIFLSPLSFINLPFSVHLEEFAANLTLCPLHVSVFSSGCSSTFPLASKCSCHRFVKSPQPKIS